ncbi:Uncharacterized protein dnm_062950 [Desulfonema magnum]|uniref:Uncharacterized protein n=1 Tax=Desulfonema magnum TaxID=45655 RepID=A0A975BRG1_9BACT|nr:Uncharacterized protein dnm_062950 [Desulfonema magnum]
MALGNKVFNVKYQMLSINTSDTFCNLLFLLGLMIFIPKIKTV